MWPTPAPDLCVGVAATVWATQKVHFTSRTHVGDLEAHRYGEERRGLASKTAPPPPSDEPPRHCSMEHLCALWGGCPSFLLPAGAVGWAKPGGGEGRVTWRRGGALCSWGAG